MNDAAQVWTELRPRLWVPAIPLDGAPHIPGAAAFNADIEQACRGHFVDGWAQALRWREGAECVMVSDQLRGAFADLIADKLREGWRLQGQPFHASGQYNQLMTRGVTP